MQIQNKNDSASKPSTEHIEGHQLKNIKIKKLQVTTFVSFYVAIELAVQNSQLIGKTQL